MKKNDFSKSIMGKIEKNEVKMKPKWEFEAKKIGVEGVWVMTILLTAIAISMLITFWEMYNPGELGEYGDVGIELIRQDFPYLWLLAGIILTTAGVAILSNLGRNYKKRRRVLLLMDMGIVALVSILVLLLKSLFKL
jgi:hypothetical protein